MKKYVVTLTAAERDELSGLVSRGKAEVRRLKHAQVLLKADASAAGPGWPDERIAAGVGVGTASVERVRRRFVEEGLERALSPYRKGQRLYARALDGEAEAHLIALACSSPPQGRARWTLRLLASRMVELQPVPGVSHETVRQTLKKNTLKPHLRKMWCIPPKHSAEFVFHMEDVLEVYCRPYDPRRPVVCLDESFKQLIGETRPALPPRRGAVARHDHVYVRNGVASLFLACEPLAGWRHVAVTAQRRRVDWARVVRDLLDGRYREAERVVLVMDQLNTHALASLYEAFPAAEARRLAERIELHHTPKHGSWLNMAEIELSALGQQCLARRIAQVDTLTQQLARWEEARNAGQTKVDWHFTAGQARDKLRSLYPSIDP
ncbi:IS630 family transposase [Methylobacterium sp. ID0610]|uniref:IS630 family transposase n=1 Tax=Methylobacterium carpenticola TaxID=3344827 RepID=UPI00367B63C2